MIILGITGSIAMGKSTVAGMLEYLGVPVHDSDAAVHEALSTPCDENIAVRALFPFYKYPLVYGKKIKSGPYAGSRPLNRKEMGKIVFKNDKLRAELEGILHPYVQKSQQKFINKYNALGQKIIGFDIPLLFETGAENRVDYTINVTAPGFIQRARVMARPNMTQDKLRAILARQMPDGEKSVRADFIVHTGLGRAYTMKQLKKILLELKPALDNKDEEQSI